MKSKDSPSYALMKYFIEKEGYKDSDGVYNKLLQDIKTGIENMEAYKKSTFSFMPMLKDASSFDDVKRLFETHSIEDLTYKAYEAGGYFNDLVNEIDSERISGEAISVTSISKAGGPTSGYRYYYSIDEAIPFLVQWAFIEDYYWLFDWILDQPNPIDTDRLEKQHQKIKDYWYPKLLMAQFLLKDHGLSTDEKLAHLIDLLEDNRSIDFEIKTLKRLSEEIAEKYSDELADQFDISFFDFNISDPPHKAWLISNLPDALYGI
jgi:hypothetical protein